MDDFGRLFLVRHGQASFGSSNYDQLSPLGVRQAQQLGAYWAARGMVFSRNFVGPRQRHHQTERAVAEMYARAGLTWPTPEPLPEFDEHQGSPVTRYVLDHTVEYGLDLATFSQNGAITEQSYLRAFRYVTRLWATGRLTVAGYESWADFRGRVERGLARVAEAHPRGGQVAVFASSGSVAAGMGGWLGLNDERTLALSWILYNTAYVAFVRSADGYHLLTFNAAPHLVEPDELTTI